MIQFTHHRAHLATNLFFFKIFIAFKTCKFLNKKLKEREGISVKRERFNSFREMCQKWQQLLLPKMVKSLKKNSTSSAQLLHQNILGQDQQITCSDEINSLTEVGNNIDDLSDSFRHIYILTEPGDIFIDINQPKFAFNYR